MLIKQAAVFKTVRDTAPSYLQNGIPGENCIHNLRFRKPLLYLVELRESFSHRLAWDTRNHSGKLPILIPWAFSSSSRLGPPLLRPVRMMSNACFLVINGRSGRIPADDPRFVAERDM